MIKYKKPRLFKYKVLEKVTNTSMALEGTVNLSDCTLGRCGGTPPPVKG